MSRALFNLGTLLSITVFAWIAFAWAVFPEARADSSLPPFSPIVSWEGLLAASPFAATIGVIVKWFMNHIDVKDTMFLQALDKKDEIFARLLQECYAERKGDHERIIMALTEALQALQALSKK